ncbi:hypothetical protein NLN86_22505 [Citrobacter portucalensis]|uniref:Transposase n=1 Tax=Citrobacter portucalensis TaxID=1639133 RepID=A0AAW5WFC4_9ENTR|nr:hypothetical protein [Citrobacter portucalensis]MCX9004402.1 hypothetical protein [Citrobacter portucalensis]
MYDQAGKSETLFFNPGLIPKQLEDWLELQKLYLAHLNRLVKEKSALEERLNEIFVEIELMSISEFAGKMSFP